MKSNHLRVAAGIGLIVVLAVWLWPRGNDAEPEAAAAAGESTTATRSVVTDQEAPGDRDTRNATRPTREPLAEHTVDQLGDWILPAVDGRDVTFRSALGILMAAYKDACQRSRSAPLVLEFSYPPDDGARISFSMERSDFRSALRRIASLAGYRVVMEGEQISFVPMPANLHTSEHSLQVPPDFAMDLKQELQRLGIRHDESIGGMLAAAGIVGPERQVTLAGNGTLVATVSQAELERLEARLSGLKAPRQLKAAVKLVLSDSPLELETDEMTKSQVDDLLRSLAGRKGTKVVTAPSMTMRDQQEGTIEMIRELPDGWTGTRLTIEAETVGLSIVSRDTTQYRPDDHPKPYLQRTTHAVLADGKSQISLVGRKGDTHLYRLMSLEAIDATGRPIGGAAGGSSDTYDFATPIPDSPGFVISPFNGKKVDVREIPSGTLVQDPTYPPSEKKYFRVP
jgi:hypothetical protein